VCCACVLCDLCCVLCVRVVCCVHCVGVLLCVCVLCIVCCACMSICALCVCVSVCLLRACVQVTCASGSVCWCVDVTCADMCAWSVHACGMCVRVCVCVCVSVSAAHAHTDRRKFTRAMHMPQVRLRAQRLTCGRVQHVQVCEDAHNGTHHMCAWYAHMHAYRRGHAAHCMHTHMRTHARTHTHTHTHA